MSSVAVTPDGRDLGVQRDKRRCGYGTWNMGQAASTLQGHSESVFAVAVTPDGRWGAISASRDHTLQVWDLGSGQTVLTLQGHSFLRLRRGRDAGRPGRDLRVR